MARTELSVQTIDNDGMTPSYEAANADGEEFANNGDVFIHMKNGSGGAIVATFKTPATVSGVSIDEVEVTISAAGEEMVGPFDPAVFNQADGNVDVDFDGVTSLTIAALKLPSP